MKVSLRILGEIKIDNHVDTLNVDTSGEQVGRNQATARALTEIVEDPISVGLLHSGVDVEATEAQLCNLLGEQLHARDGIAKDDSLVDVQLGEQRVQAMNLLALLHKCIILRNSPQRQLIHQVDDVRIGHVLLVKITNGNGVGSRIHEELPVFGQQIDELLDNRLKLWGQKLVRFVHNAHAALREIRNSLICQIQNSSWRSYQDVNCVV
mmetsp:Transcript_31560/g.69085  ORF Transcript_31560/g.69085 Transcript_31560/m.69085 type:complete len:209 (-) Transcript_31560:747-1373(-)